MKRMLFLALEVHFLELWITTWSFQSENMFGGMLHYPIMERLISELDHVCKGETGLEDKVFID